MAEVIESTNPQGFYYSCDLCMMAGPMRETQPDAQEDCDEHNSDDVHRMNEVHESRSARR